MNIASVDHRLCMGCKACAAACPAQAINFSADALGFMYPCVDGTRCTGCGACSRACPLSSKRPARTPHKVYVARCRDVNRRMESASGGLFGCFARMWIRQSGIVYGVVWDSVRKCTRMVRATTSDELRPIYNTKYVQADVGDVYVRIREDLNEGRRVLFSGTPCQVFGLTCFLQRDYENLLIVDVICMGVPSVKTLAMSCPELFQDCAEVNVVFRNKKRDGWRRSCMNLQTGVEFISANGKTCASTDFYALMSRRLVQRESCYPCPARGLRSGSDITIGDFWRVGEYYPKYDDDTGVSLALVHSDKGAALWRQASAALEFDETNYEIAIRINRQLVEPLPRPADRDRIGLLIEQGFSLSQIRKRLAPPVTPMRHALYALKRRLLAIFGRGRVAR